MSVEIGRIEALFRYPVKSMRGESLDAATLGWHGFVGDRRLALRRLDDRGGFPWLTASQLPDLVRFAPLRLERGGEDAEPSHVRTPEGEVFPVFSEALAAEVQRRRGAAVEMTRTKHGVFDEGSVSVIASSTVEEICRLAGVDADARRFRPNILVRSTRHAAFEEDEWVGGVLAFGESGEAPTVTVTLRDIRCVMMNFDPDGGAPASDLLKTVVRVHDNTAGVYGTVTRIGRLAVGDRIELHR